MASPEEQQAFEAAFTYRDGAQPANVTKHYAGALLVDVQIDRPSGPLEVTADGWAYVTAQADYVQYVKAAED